MKRLKTLGKYLVLFLKAFNVLSIIFLLLLYFIVKKVGIHFDWFIMMIYPCGICFIYIVHEFILMFETFKEKVSKDYFQRYRIKPLIFLADICDGLTVQDIR